MNPKYTDQPIGYSPLGPSSKRLQTRKRQALDEDSKKAEAPRIKSKEHDKPGSFTLIVPSKTLNLTMASTQLPDTSYLHASTQMNTTHMTGETALDDSRLSGAF